MADPENPHMVAGNPISDDVGVDDRQLAQLAIWNRSAAPGKGLEAVAGGDQRLCQIPGGLSVEAGDIPLDLTDVAQR
jgi:hypothetical protein